MNKNDIQKYAVWARNELIEQVKQRAYQYGINDKGYGDERAAVIAGRVLSTDETRQRTAFVREIQQHGYQQAVEEVAYTWFNRFVALRFMEVNDYLPTHIRVFSDASGGFNPEILKDVLHLELDELDRTKVSELLNANQTEELYRYLLLTQCNALNAALPEMFEKLGSYTEILLPNNILKQDSVLAHLVTDIDEDDWKDAVQIIGWMYQYYNTEPKAAVFSRPSGQKIKKEEIPAATQIFTPDWIVRYMVENSLGRLWLESHPNTALKVNWKYYLDEAEQTPEVAESLRVLRSQNPVISPEDIRLVDPCMGSGHILVYAFDVLMQIYESEGYNPRDAAKLILEKNIYGLDIDRRAYQLAYFSLMMKARQYNRRIFTDGVKPQVYHPAGFPDGEEYGSLVKVNVLPQRPVEKAGQLSLDDTSYDMQLNDWNFKRLLVQKYDVVVTNPPYMGGNGMGAKLSEFVKKNYPDSKSDLFAVFIEKCGELLKPTGYQAMITQHAWMFLSSYEKLRGKLITRDIVNMAHLGARAFEEIGGEVVQTITFVLSKRKTSGFNGKYVRLVDFGSQRDKEIEFLCGEHRYSAAAENFTKIPGSPVAYWVSQAMLQTFDGKYLSDYAQCCTGMQTGNNDKYVRTWFEVNYCDTVLHKANGKYKRYNCGGESRKWYGNHTNLVLWGDNGESIKSETGSVIRNESYFFKEGISWKRIGSTDFFLRYLPEGFIFDQSGDSMFVFEQATLPYILGFVNTKVALGAFEYIAPTLNLTAGNMNKLPIIISSNDDVDSLVISNISLSRADWDAFETSWDFKAHPLVELKEGAGYGADMSKWNYKIKSVFENWETFSCDCFNKMKANEEELNRIFIDIYGLQEELTPEIEDKDVTVRPANLKREIRSLISYAVGCMFGRYSLDAEGLAYAGGDWDNSKYIKFIPDNDNILPICDDEYFDDDIMGRFVNFIRVVYGAETLEENLKFIADALGKSGTPREAIRAYFLNDFYKDHCKIYKKCPIYWLFESGKNNGFKALIYLHRYQSNLLAKLRTDYVHEQQERYRTQLSHIAIVLNTAVAPERARLLKQQNKLTEQLKETTAFEEKVHHLADQNIEIDLDDGVKKNYEIFTDVLAKI